jgi:hypothetical protein
VDVIVCVMVCAGNTDVTTCVGPGAVVVVTMVEAGSVIVESCVLVNMETTVRVISLVSVRSTVLSRVDIFCKVAVRSRVVVGPGRVSRRVEVGPGSVSRMVSRKVSRSVDVGPGI